MRRDLSMSAAARALQSMGKLEVVHVTDAPRRAKTLRDACIERGIDPDNTGYKVPQQRLLNIDRIIPGVADRVSPAMHECFKYRQNAHPRKMYTRQSAANDAAQIAEGGVEAYVAAFCRLNNLTEG